MKNRIAVVDMELLKSFSGITGHPMAAARRKSIDRAIAEPARVKADTFKKKKRLRLEHATFDAPDESDIWLLAHNERRPPIPSRCNQTLSAATSRYAKPRYS